MSASLSHSEKVMTTPANLTLIPLGKQDSLARLKQRMLDAPTDYVMVINPLDQVVVDDPLTGDVHYLPSLIRTRRALRYVYPVIDYDPLLLSQHNICGSPIIHKDLVPLFPIAAQEPYHGFLVAAMQQGASISLVDGMHQIVDPWPRPEVSGAYHRWFGRFDPAAVQAVAPGLLVVDLADHPMYYLQDTRKDTVEVFHTGCSPQFLDSLKASWVTLTPAAAPQISQTAAYTAWFEGIEEALDDQTLDDLRIALHFPQIEAASPRIVNEYSIEEFTRRLPWECRAVYRGLNSRAWIKRSTGSVPTTGGTYSRVVLRET